MHTHSHTEGTARDALRHTNIPCSTKHYGLTDSRPSIQINSALVPLPTVCVEVKCMPVDISWQRCVPPLDRRLWAIHTPTINTHWASDTLPIPSVRIYSLDCHYSKSHYSPALLYHDNTLQHALLHPIRPAKTKNTTHQGGGQRKGILRLWTQTAFQWTGPGGEICMLVYGI